MNTLIADSRPTGSAQFNINRGTSKAKLRHILGAAMPQRGLSDAVNDWRSSNLRNFLPGMLDAAAARLSSAPTLIGSSHLMVTRGDGTVEDLGLASMKVVTTAGVTAIASHMNNNAATISAFKYIGFGSGATAAAIGDTALQTEYTTQYAVDSTRPTGTQSNPSANVYQCVATFAPDSGTIVNTECGVFSAASAGTLLDRFVYSAVNLTPAADSLQVTFQLTFTAGG